MAGYTPHLPPPPPFSIINSASSEILIISQRSKVVAQEIVIETYLVQEWQQVRCGSAGCELTAGTETFYWASNCTVWKETPSGSKPCFITTNSPLSLLPACLTFISFFRQIQLNLGFRLIQRKGKRYLGSLTDFMRDLWGGDGFFFFLNLRTQLHFCLISHRHVEASEVIWLVFLLRMDWVWPSPDGWVSIMCLQIEAPFSHVTKVEIPVDSCASMLCSPCLEAELAGGGGESWLGCAALCLP